IPWSILMRMYVLAVAVILGLLLLGGPARSADPQEETIKRFIEALKGEWQMTSRVDNGVATDEKMVRNRIMIFEADRYLVRDAGKVSIEATYRVDPARKPTWFDIVLAAGPSKGKIE